MPQDITKPNSHSYWLWLAIFTLAYLTLAGYNALKDRSDYLSDKMNSSELQIKIQMAEIKSTLTSMDMTLIELKQAVNKRNETDIEAALNEIKRDLKRRVEP